MSTLTPFNYLCVGTTLALTRLMLPRCAVAFLRSLTSRRAPAADEALDAASLEASFELEEEAEPGTRAAKVVGLVDSALVETGPMDEVMRPRPTITVWIGDTSFQAALV